jgi:hypothetical protein
MNLIYNDKLYYSTNYSLNTMQLVPIKIKMATRFKDQRGKKYS